MYIVFALLINDTIHNLLREISLECFNETGNFDFNNLILPHISIKQSFETHDISKTTELFDTFFSKYNQFEVEIDIFEIIEDNTYPIQRNILWLKIKTNSILTDMHNNLNQLLQDFGIFNRLYDGDDYTFHITVLLGPMDLTKLKLKLDKLNSLSINKTILIKKAVMFLCPYDYIDLNRIITYRLTNLQHFDKT